MLCDTIFILCDGSQKRSSQITISFEYKKSHNTHFIRTSIRPSIVNINGFSQIFVCALILWWSGLGLLMCEFRQLLMELAAHDMFIFSFLKANLRKCQWIFTKLGICIDIMEICFRIANGQSSSIFVRVICLWHYNGEYYRVTILLHVEFIQMSGLTMWCTFNPVPAGPGRTLPLQTVQIQISWLLKKPTDLDLHCLSFSMWICIMYQQPGSSYLICWKLEVAWHLNLFIMARVKSNKPSVV